MKTHRPLLLVVCVLLLVGLAPVAPAQDSDPQPDGPREWDPASTWVFGVGVIEFKGEMTEWPQEGRKDVVLMDRFKARGVPGDHVKFLKDKDATRDGVAAAFAEFRKKPGANDTLIVYFTGHGSRGDNGDTCFTPYDYDSGKRAETGWGVADIFSGIEADFQGKRAWLMADCCYSGALCVEARKHRGSRVAYACFASSSASTESTGNWTFTECIIRAIDGDPVCDLNGDGMVRMREAASFAETEMAFAEGQLSTFAAVGRFGDLKVADRTGEADTAKARRIEVKSDGEWYAAQVLDSREGELKVHYIGWEAKWDEWVKMDRVRDWAPTTHAAGTKVEVKWKGKWYPAKVLEGKLGLHLITYDGFGSNWDEWVGLSRIRVPE